MQASMLFAGKNLCPGYQLKQLLGQGKYGSVWQAETPEAQPVALKFLKCSDSNSAAVEIRAIQCVRKFPHPNLIRIREVFCQSGYVVIVMPLADGSLLDLYQACQDEYSMGMIPEEVCPLLLQVAEGLDFLNTRQHLLDGVRVAIQHCDVKPSNMLLQGDTVVLCDFGLAALTTSVMKMQRPAGTLDYAAPEIFQSKLSDSTDQYALAVSYCHLRGGLPFSDAPQGFERTYVRPKPDLSMLGPSELAIVARGLSPVPQDRWPSCRAMMQELLKATGGPRRR